jgi:hypothetical protein
MLDPDLEKSHVESFLATISQKSSSWSGCSCCLSSFLRVAGKLLKLPGQTDRQTSTQIWFLNFFKGENASEASQACKEPPCHVHSSSSFMEYTFDCCEPASCRIPSLKSSFLSPHKSPRAAVESQSGIGHAVIWPLEQLWPTLLCKFKLVGALVSLVSHTYSQG